MSITDALKRWFGFGSAKIEAEVEDEDRDTVRVSVDFYNYYFILEDMVSEYAKEIEKLKAEIKDSESYANGLEQDLDAANSRIESLTDTRYGDEVGEDYTFEYKPWPEEL